MSEMNNQYLIISDENRARYFRILRGLLHRTSQLWLNQFLRQIHPTAIAQWWSSFTIEEQNMLISALDAEANALLIAELHENYREDLFSTRNLDWIAEHLSELDSDDVVDILRGLNQGQANAIILRLDKKDAEKIKALLQYPEETAGSLMSLDFLAVKESATIETIIRQFRKVVEEEEIDDIHFVYVLDSQSILKGYIPLRKLILEKASKIASEVMIQPPVLLHPEMDQEEVVKIFRNYDLISVPVVDQKGALLGRITIDDVVDVLDEEASEDVYRMVGLTKDEHSSNDILVSLRHRLPWMFLNLLTASLSVTVIGFFQSTLQALVVLAMFMPMVAALGGATANQMVALVVRGLALGEIDWPRLRWLLFRELIAVVIGALLIGIIAGTFASQLEGMQSLGFVVASALLLNMIFATLVGTGIPFFLKFLRLDPALGSSILVSAMTDMMGFFIFLGLATRFLMH